VRCKQGQPPILSRYKAPEDHATWSPNSVLSVKTQTWAENYADKNIADNPIIPTIADLLIGPDRCGEVLLLNKSKSAVPVLV
jgi:hypothetical protein